MIRIGPAFTGPDVQHGKAALFQVVANLGRSIFQDEQVIGKAGPRTPSPIVSPKHLCPAAAQHKSKRCGCLMVNTLPRGGGRLDVKT
ncbi:hypothetical protein ACFFV8_10595 [Sphingobium indicum]|uniref:Uncharacterized protein n=1 Tax=Sphingobium indicum (strain DSM 16413 / CCM 7287 / MTCC 6362 / UT26 / NBRC 101211 / UT26S) TaxID=452662 RepID=D4Z2B7_SPHIU|nr:MULTISPECIES: hypothetical protein [Sphingobium]BAI96749.1 hypothetical protein SJA_C1-19150 [Sphingobium indicum UT26S]